MDRCEDTESWVRSPSPLPDFKRGGLEAEARISSAISGDSRPFATSRKDGPPAPNKAQTLIADASWYRGQRVTISLKT